MKKNKASGVYLPNILEKTKKSSTKLAPIYEAFTNSWESIDKDTRKKSEISIHFTFTSSFTDVDENEYELDTIEIKDTGIGFDATNFERIQTYADNRKGFYNKGMGRLQFIKFFEEAHYRSNYRDKDNILQRQFTISKKNIITNNSMIDIVDERNNHKDTGTSLVFKKLIESKDKIFYDAITIDELKKELIKHYMVLFCLNRNTLPKITLQFSYGKTIKTESIKLKDLPDIDKKEKFRVPFYRDSIETEESKPKEEEFELYTYKLDKDQLEENEIKFACKGEIISSLPFEFIPTKDDLKGYKYLMIISGSYIDNHINDTRDEFKFKSKKDIKKEPTLDMFQDEIALEDIRDQVYDKILELYPEFQEVERRA